MNAVTLSSKFQIVIPLAVRSAMGLSPGTRLQVVPLGDRIELIPMRSAKSLRGVLAGIDTNVPRDGDRV